MSPAVIRSCCHGCTWRVALLVLSLVLGPAAAGVGEAQQLPPPDDPPPPRPANLPAEEDSHRVVILPVLDLTGTHGNVAVESSALLVEGLARFPRFEVLAGSALTDRLKAADSFLRELGEARMLARLGQQEYERIRLAEAIKLLDLAEKKFSSIHFELVEPREVARTLLTLAKAYIENGEEMKAEGAFQRLLLDDPLVRLLPGRFSDNVIALFERARYWVTQDRLPGLRTEQALSVAARVRASYVVSASLRPRPEAGRFLLGVQLLDVRRKVPLALEQVAVAEGQMASPEGQVAAAEGQDRLVEQLDRLTSRLAACVPNDVWLARQRNPEPFPSTLSFDTSYQHLFFLQHLLQSGFSGMGLSSGISWAPIEHLVLLVRLSFTTSRNNYPYEDLLDPVNLLRLLLGAGIAHHGTRLSVFTVTGFDLSYPFAFDWTREADCKWHAPLPFRCKEEGLVHTHDPGPVFGLHVGAGVIWTFAPPLLLHFRGGLSYLFLPTEGNELNLPIDLAAGLGYRF